MNRFRSLISDCRMSVVFMSLLMSMLFVPAVQAGDVYQSVMQELSRHENRLPGSDSFNSSLDHLEKTLKGAGLVTHRQTYDTLVPETTECRLLVDGSEIEGVLPLGPNTSAHNTTGGKVLKGPLVYLGHGTLAEMAGKTVEGCIAVLRFDSPHMMQVFSQGALAIVFVGDGTETQWEARRQFVGQAEELPRLFIDKAASDLVELTSNKAGRVAEVSLTTTWKDVVGVNLWVEVKGEAGAKFKFDQEEAIVLTATLDTFGTVPERSPSDRKAANVALLAEVITDLNDKPLKRSVFALFLGSHYAMQDGARTFYYAVRRGKGDGLEERAKNYVKMQDISKERLSVLGADNIFDQKSPELKTVVSRVEKRLNAKVSTLNYELRVTRDQLVPLRRLKTMLPADEKAMAALLAEEERIQLRRKALNGLRRQFNDREITDSAIYSEIAGEEKELIKREIDDVTKFLEHNLTHRELAKRISSKRIMGHFDIDFANSTSDWTLNMESVGSQMFYHSMGLKWASLKMGDYVRNFLSIAKMDKDLGGKGAPGNGIFTEPASSIVPPGKFCVPSIRSSANRVAHSVQVYGYQLLNVAEPLNGDDLPYRQDVDLEPLVPRVIAFSAGLATDPSISQTCPLAEPKRHKNAVFHFRGEGGLRFLKFARGSEELAGVPQDGVVFCAPNRSDAAPTIAGHSYSASSRIRASGHIFIPGLYSHVKFKPFGYNTDGSLQYFPRGSKWADPRMFYGVGGVLNMPLLPGKIAVIQGTLASGKTDATLTAFTGKATDHMAVYYDENEPFKFYDKAGILLLGSTEVTPRGTGIPIDQEPLYSFNVLRQTAHDYLILNNSRLQVLRDKSIVNDSLESLHADADQHWQEAVAAREAKDVAGAVAHEAFSAGISSRVAPALREVTNDMVRAVVLLLLLTLPFAFIMERLFISATSIYGQVLGFVGFFISSFMLMYFVHPAFQVASSPLIIFLAFVIILLSVLVITIVVSKFKKELRAMQGLSTSAHGVASDSSTSFAAVLIGISGMRNRPLKTFLTGLTIVLLTFAIVVFASFSPAIGVGKEYLGKGSGENRIEIHRYSGLEIPTMLYEAVASMYSRDWHTFARESFFRGPSSTEEGDLLVVYSAETKKWQRLQGMAAFDQKEMVYNKALAKALPELEGYEGELPPLFLSAKMTASMGVSVGETLTVAGKAYTFAGSFKATDLDQLEYMDRSKLLPPDFESAKSEMSATAGGEASSTELSNDEFVDTTRFTYCSARSIGVTVLGALHELDGPLQPTRMNGIVMYAGDSADVDDAAEQLAKMFVGPIMAKGASGVNKFFFSTAMQATGFSVIIVPLLLGGLIIFNSLLGSIVERQKEIFTYSAMGLAPPSVGALFFAESGVYAILGGMGGYLVSQLVAKLVATCGEMGWFVPPEMNFSSLSSVLTSFVVMGMVMISTIYPAIKAGRSANPGVARKWKMPAAKEGRIDFIFPFTVAANDMGGILAFISEHFANHADSSIGSFAAVETSLFRQKDGEGMGLRSNVSLAPFDLGVMQEFTIFSRPSEIEDIDEIVVQLHKVSGSDGAWLRGNRVFVDDLREQFLLWRSLPVSTVMHYREQSEKVTATADEKTQHAMENEI